MLFSDADDYFSENVNRLFDDYENSVMDVIYIPYKTIDLITGEDLEDGLCVTNLEEDLYKKRSDTLRYRCYSPWAKMVKVSMIERYSIKFEEVVASNDVWFSVNVGYVAKEIDICNYIVYIRNVRYGSLQYSLNKEYLLSRIKVGYKVNDFLYDINKIEYYNYTLWFVLALIKIDLLLFFKQMIIYIYKTHINVQLRSIYRFFKEVVYRIIQ